jgi:hypothetical protein
VSATSEDKDATGITLKPVSPGFFHLKGKKKKNVSYYDDDEREPNKKHTRKSNLRLLDLGSIQCE